MDVQIDGVMRCPTCGADPDPADLAAGPGGTVLATVTCDRCGRAAPVTSWLAPRMIVQVVQGLRLV